MRQAIADANPQKGRGLPKEFPIGSRDFCPPVACCVSNRDEGSSAALPARVNIWAQNRGIAEPAAAQDEFTIAVSVSHSMDADQHVPRWLKDFGVVH